MVVKIVANSSGLVKKRKAKSKPSSESKTDKNNEAQADTSNVAKQVEETNADATSAANGMSTFKKLKLNNKFTSECNLPKDQVTLAVSTTYKAYSASSAKSKSDSLFSDEPEIINLQVSLIKLPAGSGHPIACSIPHPYLSHESDVMLIVKDLEKGWEKSHEPTTDFYTELLAKKSVTGSFEVLPLRQLRIENKPYEARNKLSKRFDVVFVDKRVAKFVPRYLGKAFYSSGKLPVTIDLEKEDLQKEFKRAFSTSMMSMTNDGVSTRIAVGRTDQPQTEIVENIMVACETLRKKLPGTFSNVRALSIHIGNHSWSVPVYVSFATKDMISLPDNVRKTEPIVDELTTLEPGWKVAVYPGGVVKKIKDKSSAVKPLKETDDATEKSEENQLETTDKARPKRSSKGDDDSSDDDADLLEEQYLEEIEESDEEDKNAQATEVPPPKRKK